MSEPITLTDDELGELTQHFALLAPIVGLQHVRSAIASMFDRLNELRQPIPIGTVRADGDGNIAVKVSSTANDQWFVHRTQSARCSGYESDEYLADWPIVHKPE